MKLKIRINFLIALLFTSFFFILGFQNCSQKVNLNIQPSQSSALIPAEEISPSAQFTIKFSAFLKHNPNVPNHYPATWSGVSTESQGFYVNNTGKNLVLKRFRTKLTSQEFNIGNADVDLGLSMVSTLAPSDREESIHMTRNGLEIISTNQHKSFSDQDWPLKTWDVEFPGQGLLVPPNHYIVCNSQGSTLETVKNDSGNSLAFFSCEIDFDYADPANINPAVQSLRSPYIDQFFTGNVSWLSSHINFELSSRELVSMWPYVSSQGQSAKICLWHRDAVTGNQTEKCEIKDFNSKGSYYSPNEFIKFNQPFSPGNRIASACTLVNNQTANGKICALYLMVTIPVINNEFKPLDINSTISESDRKSFCENTYPSVYYVSDGFFQNPEKCANMLTSENF